MSLRAKIVLALVAVVFVGVLIYTSVQQDRFQYQVCVSHRGMNHCAAASGKTPEDAIRAAQEIDCTELASGRDDNMVCLATQPSSVRLLSKK